MLNGRKLVAFCGKASCFVRGKCFAEDVSLGFGEDLGCSLRETVRAMAPRDWIAATPDQYPLEDFDAFVFQDMPKRNDSVLTFARQHARPRYLVVVENPLIDKLNAEYGRYREFTRVFTFEDEAVRKFHPVKVQSSRWVPSSTARFHPWPLQAAIQQRCLPGETKHITRTYEKKNCINYGKRSCRDGWQLGNE